MVYLLFSILSFQLFSYNYMISLMIVLQNSVKLGCIENMVMIIDFLLNLKFAKIYIFE